MHPFDAATAIAPVPEAGLGRFTAELDPAWSGSTAPHGGVLAAMVVRAMAAMEPDPELTPRALTLHYLRAPRVAGIEVAAELVRRGRRTANLTATVTQDGRTCVLALGTWARELDAALTWEPSAPELAPFERLEPMPPVPGGPVFLDRIDLRLGLGGPPFGGAGEAVSGGWVQFATARPVDAPAIAFFCDAWLPTPYVRLTRPVPVPTLDLTVHFRDPLSPALPAEPLIARFESDSAASGIFVEDGALWSGDGRLLAQSRQSALLAPLG